MNKPISTQHDHSQKGQSIVLIAFMLVALIAFVGLAVDVGMLYLRAAQFTADVDAAVLAGVTEMTGASVIDAEDRAVQFLNANGWPITDTSAIIQSEEIIGVLGVPEFAMTVTVNLDTAFMRILNIRSYRITRWAQAAYSAQADIFTPTAYNFGKVDLGNQFVYGPDSCSALGDPISPNFSAPGGVLNELPEHLLIREDGDYIYRIRIRDSYITDTLQTALRIEILDPDSYNAANGSSALVTHTARAVAGGKPATETIGNCFGHWNGNLPNPINDGVTDSCVIHTGEAKGNPMQNPFWFNRMDEDWSSSAAGCTSGSGNKVVTRFKLYYINEDNERVTLAQYTADNTQANVTDLNWVSPGTVADSDVAPAGAGDTGSFYIPDVSILPLDQFGMRYAYVEVKTLSGSTKNVFDLAAGPPKAYWATLPFLPVLTPLPSNVNLRNLAIANGYNVTTGINYPYVPYSHYWGVDVFAVAYMPLEPHYQENEIMRLPLTPVYTEQAGGGVFASLFDPDGLQGSIFSQTGARPDISFRYDTLGSSDFFMPFGGTTVINDAGDLSPEVGCWVAAYLNQCNNLWIRPDPGQVSMAMGVPSRATGVAWFGGTLTSFYMPGGDDHTWFVSVTSGRPFITR